MGKVGNSMFCAFNHNFNFNKKVVDTRHQGGRNGEP